MNTDAFTHCTDTGYQPPKASPSECKSASYFIFSKAIQSESVHISATFMKTNVENRFLVSLIFYYDRFSFRFKLVEEK